VALYYKQFNQSTSGYLNPSTVCLLFSSAGSHSSSIIANAIKTLLIYFPAGKVNKTTHDLTSSTSFSQETKILTTTHFSPEGFTSKDTCYITPCFWTSHYI